jgi:hypothetical protein
MATWCETCKLYQSSWFETCKGACGNDCKNRCSKCDNPFSWALMTPAQRLLTKEVQKCCNNFADRVERSGGELTCRVQQNDVVITYKKNS